MIADEFSRRTAKFVLAIIIFFIQSQVTAFSGDNKAVSLEHEYFQEKLRFSQGEPVRQREKRRSSNFGERKERSLCSSKSHCSGNKTVFENDEGCYCDKACFETFHDCCPDYERSCGKQNATMSTKERATFSSWWNCVKMGVRACSLYITPGVWMIQRCPPTWPSGETKRKCHNAPNVVSYPVEDFLPVVADNQFTYRNKHCAICHGIQIYSTWNLNMVGYDIPPSNYDLEAKVRYIIDNGGWFIDVIVSNGQPKRYCAGEYQSNCNNVSHKQYKDCLNGPVEVVRSTSGSYFKNKACASCNGHPNITDWAVLQYCDHKDPLVLPEFSIVFNIRNHNGPASSLIVTQSCPSGTVYDELLKFCREAYTPDNDVPAKNILINEFYLFLWFRLSPASNISIFRRHFKTALTENLYIMPSQISNIIFHNQDDRGKYIVTFRLTLTPYQYFILDNQLNLASMNISDKSKQFLKLLNFTGKFTLHFKNYRFLVINLISKQLACFKGREIKRNEYQLNNKTGEVFENKTGKYFSPKDYSILEGREGNIILCRKLVLSDCHEGSYVPLLHNEYVILSNLSLYHNRTKRTFDFGEYQINEAINGVSGPSSIDTKRSEDRLENNNFPRNATFAICLPYQRSYNITVTQIHKPRSNYALEILTWIGFCISIIWLLFLLITYGMFKELRTIPGMNLMNLTFSLLLSHCVWLMGAAGQSKLTTFCTARSILVHYLILASFFAMSVISRHSCLVFSQSFAIAETTKAKRRRTIMKYSAVVWCCPAICVITCVIVDQTGVFIIDYGTDCWLGTKNAKLYLFLVPIASLLLYNVSAFVRTAVSLSRHQSQTQLLQKKRRQNLLICTKLSTMVGFPWIFAFFGVIFPNVVAFEYLFVIFVCLQGFYIGVAFLCNAKTRKLYKNRWSRNENVNKSSVLRRQCGNTNRNIQTTKL